jgi:clan AA aspartic protease (TIGR02281 family)
MSQYSTAISKSAFTGSLGGDLLGARQVRGRYGGISDMCLWRYAISEAAPSFPSTPAPKSEPRSPTLIPLHFENGAFSVPVVINDKLTLNFLLDSGAADVSIPEDVVSTLKRTGTLSAADFLGERTYELADGSKLPSQIFHIKSLKVGDKTIENVVGSIAPVKGKLLLGQSFLRRFNSWSIDNQRHVLVLE